MGERTFNVVDFCGQSGLAATWDAQLILLSIAFAIAGSYLALDFASRMNSAPNRHQRRQWFLAGAAAMGLTVWSMHFVGMTALQIPLRVTYDAQLSALSMVAAAVGAGLAFANMSRRPIGWFHLTIGGIAMGIAIASMHYIGMASMRVAATIHYDPTRFVLSVLIAILASFGALALAYHFENPRWSLFWPKAGSAAVMGGAIAGMHYMGMSAACYLPVASSAAGAPADPLVGFVSLRDILITAGVLIGLSLLVLNAYTAVERQRALDSYAELNGALEEKVRERTAQLEATNRELAGFSYTVSHDLRAPLRSISGFTDALIDDWTGKLDANGQLCLERIKAGTVRMDHLIDGLLNLSRVTRVAIQPQTVDLSAVATTLVDELKATDPKRKVKVTVSPHLTARADPNLIASVLQNLLGNAWKFTARRENPEIEFSSSIENGERIFYVRDNGAGFNMAHAHKLFGVFERLHHVSEFPGTGIGLATVKRILDRHGGKIWAVSEENHGATLFFTLGGESA